MIPKSLRFAIWVLMAVLAEPAAAQHRTHFIPGAAANAGFGRSAATLGDVDLDSIPDFVVGGNRFAQIRSGRDGALIRQHNGPVGSLFGSSVCRIDDLDTDGIDDYLVAAEPDSTLPGYAGQVFAFSGLSGALIATASPAGISAADRFGALVIGAGDIDGDFDPDFLVAAPDTPLSGNHTGAVHAFDGASGLLLATFTGANGHDYFGTSLVRLGDRDGDGDEEWAAGSPTGNPIGGNPFFATGEVRIFSGLAPVPIASLFGDAPGDLFGQTLGAGQDYDGDGLTDLLVGAPFADSLFADEGLVRGLNLAAPAVPLFEVRGNAAGQRLGNALLATDDYDGDLLPDLIAGYARPAGALTFQGFKALGPVAAASIFDFGTGCSVGAGANLLGPGADFDGDGRKGFLVMFSGAWLAGGMPPTAGLLEVYAPAPELGPAAAGDPGGNLLRIDGSDGGLPRRVDRALNQPFTVSMLQPASNPNPARFAIFGLAFAPAFTDAAVLPFGLGTVAFPFCPAAPHLIPFAFTLTDNFGPDICGEIVPSSPGAWSVVHPTGIPFPFTFTLQAIWEDAGLQLRRSNAVILRLH